MTKPVDVLGPIFLNWIAQLDRKLRFLDRRDSARMLFCTRAGKRIHDHLLAYAGEDPAYDTALFGISRIGAVKAGLGYLSNFDGSFAVARESFADAPLGDVCAAFLKNFAQPHDPRLHALQALRGPFRGDNFRVLLAANDDASRWLRDYFEKSHDALGAQLRAELGEHRQLVLVDTGWKASIQRALQATYPDLRFAGVYFGVMDSQPMETRHSVVFDALSYQPGRPETCLAVHRHLIESLYEPLAPSVEEIAGGPCAEVAARQMAAVTGEDPSRGDATDALFLEILDYTRAHRGDPLDVILERGHAAMAELERIILFPQAADVPLYQGKPRSSDFGRDGFVPVIRGPEEGDTPEERISRALWQPGQIAVEYPPAAARAAQERLARPGDGSSYFTAYTGQGGGIAPREEFAFEGSVAIVTRTKDRPVLFERAMRSVAAQTWRNFHWVIVNDGGSRESVEEIIDRAPIDRRRITLVSNDASVGMEAASNLGVRAVDTEFVVIHDDDDSWDPRFLERCVGFLESAPAQSAGFQGVLTRAWRVSEEIRDGRVTEHGRSPFNPWVNDVTLFQMAIGNFFAPISFVYRRSMFDAIGGYSEKLPVLGDWRFNIEFLARANIGFIDEYLSYYHHRDTGAAAEAVYQNSVIGGRSVHAEYFPVVVNDLIREDRLPAGVAAVLGQAHLARIMEHRFNMVDTRLGEMDARLAQLPVPQSQAEEEQAEPLGVLLQGDRDHVVRSLLGALRGDLPEERRAVIEPLIGRLHELDDPRIREEIVRSASFAIPSPADFDHIAYLRKRTDIWATAFNGFEDLRPYHHYLIHGITDGEPRPAA
ncbi:glycosyltransferase family 2 protein [Mangrovicoccus algicola]|uniref:Glycosyltransferase family 2 protein n=1 Tax=Mangrovicoccus algicola TaxID=2771008 RepID=A0A8J6Z9I9_9RHOB|nr:glycosyltransferase family A protein [Mangrovicoccus algicola]MBE3640539.1 glycosyltransferase family 2 protein [Mangrovicoccus algicola]